MFCPDSRNRGLGGLGRRVGGAGDGGSGFALRSEDGDGEWGPWSSAVDRQERREQEEEEERRRKRPRYVDDEAEESDGSE